MKLRTLFLCAAVLGCAALMFASCSGVAVSHTSGEKIGHGPPPHAPAHGHRRKQIEGVELVYDSERGVYVAVGLPHHYYYDGCFYRLSGGQWEVSVRVSGGWESVREESIPPGLQKKGKRKGGWKSASWSWLGHSQE